MLVRARVLVALQHALLATCSLPISEGDKRGRVYVHPMLTFTHVNMRTFARTLCSHR